MQLGLSNKDQKKVLTAFSSLGEVCGTIWDNIVNDKSEEQIKKLEKKIEKLEKKWRRINE